jgi:hypothetical protein
VARDPLNYFEPYESFPPHHENQLTRALVFVLKLSPMAHAAWLRRVDGELVLHELPAVQWRVQRSLIVTPAATADFDDLRVISVFISGERTDEGGQVQATERSQILDALAVYGTELAVVVENNVTRFPDDLQSRSLNIGGVNVSSMNGRGEPRGVTSSATSPNWTAAISSQARRMRGVRWVWSSCTEGLATEGRGAGAVGGTR